jgi:hypothetical protein
LMLSVDAAASASTVPSISCDRNTVRQLRGKVNQR